MRPSCLKRALVSLNRIALHISRAQEYGHPSTPAQGSEVCEQMTLYHGVTVLEARRPFSTEGLKSLLCYMMSNNNASESPVNSSRFAFSIAETPDFLSGDILLTG